MLPFALFVHKPPNLFSQEEVYKKGFYEGTIIVGEFAGTPVVKAKPKIQAKMIEAGQAITYYEPEGLVRA